MTGCIPKHVIVASDGALFKAPSISGVIGRLIFCMAGVHGRSVFKHFIPHKTRCSINWTWTSLCHCSLFLDGIMMVDIPQNLQQTPQLKIVYLCIHIDKKMDTPPSCGSADEENKLG